MGQGVAASNLAGRTLADLITEQKTERTELPWVNHRSPDWEPEPARWIGARAGTSLANLADWADEHGHRRVRSARDRVARWLGVDVDTH